MAVTTPPTKIGNIIVTGLSILLFVLSLTQKCYCTTDVCGDSLAVLLVGFLGIFAGGAALTWLANPLLAISWILTINNSKLAWAFSMAALAICLSFLLFDTIIDDEGGHFKKIISYQAGYWLWTASATTLTLGNLVLKLIYKSKLSSEI